ncbi:MAG: hypothetical protein QM571_05745 [Micrococcaceae bacterium]
MGISSYLHNRGWIVISNNSLALDGITGGNKTISGKQIVSPFNLASLVSSQGIEPGSTLSVPITINPAVTNVTLKNYGSANQTQLLYLRANGTKFQMEIACL